MQIMGKEWSLSIEVIPQHCCMPPLRMSSVIHMRNRQFLSSWLYWLIDQQFGCLNDIRGIHSHYRILRTSLETWLISDLHNYNSIA